MLKIALLGRFDLLLHGQPVEMTSRPLQKLTAYLALNAGKSIPRAKLAGLMWLDSPESTARKNLRHHLWRLRQAIGDEYLIASRNAAGFNPAASYQLDAAELANASSDGEPEALIDAVSAYQGELLPGFYDDWVQLERDHLQAIFERRMQVLLDLLTREGRWLDLLTWAEHWIAHGQTPEPAYRSLMVGSYGLNDLAGVAMHYWRCKQTLEETLGVEPSEETETLYRTLTDRGRVAGAREPEQTTGVRAAVHPAGELSDEGILSADWLRAALADLSGGDEAAIERLAQLIQEWPRSGGISSFDRLILAGEIRSLGARRSLATETSDKLLELLVEDKAAELMRLPEFLSEGTIEPAAPIFVGREDELARLMASLDGMRSGHGQLLFVAGDVGSGKTSLLNAFIAQVSAITANALVAYGQCEAFAGRGDPYSPFRQALSMMAGDIEQSWWSGNITAGQGRHIWRNMPVVTDLLLDYGSDLLDTFIAMRPLLNRLEESFPGGHPAIERLRQSAGRELTYGQSDRSALFEQVVATIRQVAKEQPVVLVLDDLQWADRGSLDLLFHLSRSLSGSHILIIVAYRPDEIDDRTGRTLRLTLAELRRAHGDIWLDLNRASGRNFVDAFVDSEPNRLDQEFRDSLFQNTAGHPLFTIELLRNMQQTGDLIRDETGMWTAQPSLDWNLLPARVDGAIESRLSHLDGELRDILNVASVQGATFTAQIAAQVGEIDELHLARALNQELQDRYRLVRQEHSQQHGERQVIHYRFVHQLYQRYLYDRLLEPERRELHGRVGQALEDLYHTKDEALVNQLARHFDEAGISSKAAQYLLAAGDQARMLFAIPEAIANYQRAVEHLQQLGDDELLARAFLRLGLTYHNAFDYRRSRQAYDRAFHYWERVKPPPEEQLNGATLRVWEMEPATLDPTGPGDDDTGIWLMQLFSGLVKLSAEKVIVPDIAHSWEIHDGGKTYAFDLRDDARWSDGQPVTAHDFILAWKRRLDPTAHDADAERFFDIKGARSFHQGLLVEDAQLGLRAPADLKLIVELEKPTSYFLHMLAAPYSFPVPNHAVERLGRQWARPGHIVTNGPFKILDWSPETGVFLDRNPYYHGLARGNVHQVKVSLLHPDAGWQSGMEQYMAGQIDFLQTSWFPRKIVMAAQRRYGEFYTKLVPRPTTFYIGFDGQQLPLRDVRLRQAFAMAIDQAQLVSDLQKDDASPALGGYVPLGLPGHASDIGLPYDPEGARRLMAEAGYPDGQGLPAMEIIWFDLPSLRETAEYTSQLWWDVLGISIRPVFMAIADVMAYFANGTPPAVWGGGWSADYHDPDCFLRLGLHNAIRDHRPIQGRLTAARTMTEQQGRLAVYREVDRMVIEEAICIPLYYGEYSAFFSPRVRKIAPDFRWSDFIVDPD